MKIYIFSTFQDLKDHRDKVYRQLRKMRHDVISMEDYVAGDQWPLAQCLADVGVADIYVGSFAWRHGYVPPHDNPDNQSIPELEYRKYESRWGVACGSPLALCASSLFNPFATKSGLAVFSD
jgi:Domain of unknown function (DUF4062)